jgi:choline kinase
MIGIVLAAGEGKRLRPLTDTLPKTLLPVDGERSMFELALANLRHVGLDEVVVVTGHAAERIDAVAPRLERQLGLRLTLLPNDRARIWNNAYSLWLAREAFAEDALLVNGDTVHPASVEERLLDHDATDALLLALDDVKPLGEEEMKVVLDDDGHLSRIHKSIAPDQAHGEYIGVTRIPSSAAAPLAKALEATWNRDPGLYYEDGFQQYADWGDVVGAVRIGEVDWVEVDDHEDLKRARMLACRS